MWCFRCQTNGVYFYPALEKHLFFLFFFKFQSSVKWILMGRTQSSVPVELPAQVSLAAACAVNDGEGKECLRRSALEHPCRSALGAAGPSREIRRESCSERRWRRAWAHDGSGWERRYLEASDLSISLPVRPTTYWNLCFIHFSLERLRKKKNSPGIHQFKKYISLHYGVLSYFKLSPLLFV